MRVVCAIGVSQADEAAVREACAVAGRRGHVALVCVLDPSGGDGRLAAHAPSALERAMRQASAARVRSSVYLLHHDRALDVLLGAAAADDALVLGAYASSA